MSARLHACFYATLLSFLAVSCGTHSSLVLQDRGSLSVNTSAKGQALVIGLNRLSTKNYPGDGKLIGCENDATDLAKVARSQGFEVRTLTTKNATKKAVRDAIKRAQVSLKSGDTFVITFSGHGGRALDENRDEADGQDETWCLYDGQIVDDELAQWWSGFNAGVRILVLSDSCYSGTVHKIFAKDGTEIPDPASGTKAFTDNQMDKLFLMSENQNLDKNLPQERESKKKTYASVILFAACQDDEKAKDAQGGNRNSLFTSRLMGVWAGGGYQGTLIGYYKKICEGMPRDQNPNMDRAGKSNHRFETQRPWSK